MANENEPLQQGEIEQLLKGSSEGASGAKVDEPADNSPAPSEIGTPSSGGTPEGPETKSGPTSTPQPSQTPQPTNVGKAGDLIGDDEIEKLLGQAGKTPLPPKEPATAEKPLANPMVGDDKLAHGDVEYLLSQAEQALESINAEPGRDLPTDATTFQLEEFIGAPATTDKATLDLISDVELDLKIELGRTDMYLEDVLKLRKGSVVPLDKLAGDPVDIYVNGRLIARGEVLVLNDNFCVRVAELIVGAHSGR